MRDLPISPVTSSNLSELNAHKRETLQHVYSLKRYTRRLVMQFVIQSQKAKQSTRINYFQHDKFDFDSN